MKDSDRLDRVRLVPEQIHSSEGLEVDRLTTIEEQTKREEYGALACDSLYTILGILDCEQSLEEKNKAKMFLKQMIDKSEICRGLKGIRSLISRVKSQIQEKNSTKEDKSTNEVR